MGTLKLRKLVYLPSIILLPIIILFIGKYLLVGYFYQFQFDYTYTQLLLLILVSPLLEEIVFRGLVQDFLLKKIKYKYVAFVGVNVLFVLIHIDKNTGSIYLIFLFICGIIFSVVKEKSGRLLYAILLHTYYNSLFITFTMSR